MKIIGCLSFDLKKEVSQGQVIFLQQTILPKYGASNRGCDVPDVFILNIIIELKVLLFSMQIVFFLSDDIC